MAEAAEQLCLLDAIAAAEPDLGAEPEIDLVDAVLESCGGDARIAIRELLLDADFLRDQLHTASMMMSHGMGRGWRPKYERV